MGGGYGIYETVKCDVCGKEREREARADNRGTRCRSCAATLRNLKWAKEGIYKHRKKQS